MEKSRRQVLNLKRCTREEKCRYKAYKAKKTWVVAGITLVSSAVLFQVPALADSATALNLGETTSTQIVPNAELPPPDETTESAQTQAQAEPQPENESVPLPEPHIAEKTNVTSETKLQTLRVTVVDDEAKRNADGTYTPANLWTNEILGQGGSNTVLSDETKQAYLTLIRSYQDQGYVLVSQDHLPATYDDDPASDQHVTLHLKHGVKIQAGASKTVSEKINYVYASGPNQGKKAAESYQQNYLFTASEKIDRVTNEVLETTWSPAEKTLEIASPTIEGYTAEQASVPSQTITHDSANLETTVSYWYDKQTVKVLYSDMTFNRDLPAQTQVLYGEAGTSYTNKLWDYEAAGYRLVGYSPDALAGVFDDDPKVEQIYLVILAHDYELVPDKVHSMNYTIKFVYADGPKKGQTAAPDNVQTISFLAQYRRDKVTQRLEGAIVWDPYERIVEGVDSPEIPGYEPNVSQIAGWVAHGSENRRDMEYTVEYRMKPQKVNIHYLDIYNNEAGVEVKVQTLTGDAKTSYTAELWDHAAKGYKLVKAQPEVYAGNFDNDPEVDQDYYVYLTHDIKDRAGTPKIVTQTVEFIYGNGPDQGRPAAEKVTKDHTFTSVETVDQVTGEVLNTTWSEAQMTDVIAIPVIAGYEPDVKEVAAQRLTHEAADLKTTVTYRAGEQTVKVHYIDTFGNKNVELSEHLQTLKGQAGESYTNTLWDHGKAGYKLVEMQAGAKAGNFDEDPSVVQEYYVYLTHGLAQMKGEGVTVTDTVNYIYGNGPERGQEVQPAVITAKTFVPLYTFDQVTGEALEINWLGDGVIQASQVPQVQEYHSNKEMLEQRVLTPEDGDQNQIVYYWLDKTPEEPGEPGEPSKPEKPGESKEPEKPVEPTEPSKPDESGEPAEPSQPDELDDPVDSSFPLSSSQPTDELQGSGKEQGKTQVLPQTGEVTAKGAFIGGLALTLAGLLGLTAVRRKEER